ncbi:hypothetical protein Tco_0475190 [Tanacetum coccineum]
MTSQKAQWILLCSSVEKARNYYWYKYMSDDIIFAGSTHELCDLFASVGIFINQSKYALESLKKYGFESCDPVDTPMVEKSKLDEDKEGKDVDPSHYRGMIAPSFTYSSRRLTYQFAICMCALFWYQAWPNRNKQLNAVTVKWILSDADHAGCQDTRRSTSGSIQLLGDRLVSWSSKRQKSVAISSTEAEYIALSGCCAQVLWIQ